LTHHPLDEDSVPGLIAMPPLSAFAQWKPSEEVGSLDHGKVDKCISGKKYFNYV